MVDVLMRHHPELGPALEGCENAFAPGARLAEPRGGRADNLADLPSCRAPRCRERPVQPARRRSQRRPGDLPPPPHAGRTRDAARRRRPRGAARSGLRNSHAPGPVWVRVMRDGAAAAGDRRRASRPRGIAGAVRLRPARQAARHEPLPARRADDLARRAVGRPAPLHRGRCRHRARCSPPRRAFRAGLPRGGRGAGRRGRARSGVLGYDALHRGFGASRGASCSATRRARTRSSATCSDADVRGQRAAGRALGELRAVRRPDRAATSRRPRREACRPVRQAPSGRRHARRRPGPALAVRDAGHAERERAARAGADRQPSLAARARRARAGGGARASLDGAGSRDSPTCGLPARAMRLWTTTPLLSRETLVELELARLARPGRHAGLIFNTFHHRDRERLRMPTASRPRSGRRAPRARTGG